MSPEHVLCCFKMTDLTSLSVDTEHLVVAAGSSELLIKCCWIIIRCLYVTVKQFLPAVIDPPVPSAHWYLWTGVLFTHVYWWKWLLWRNIFGADAVSQFMWGCCDGSSRLWISQTEYLSISSTGRKGFFSGQYEQRNDSVIMWALFSDRLVKYEPILFCFLGWLIEIC